ncbi:MAG: efflux RND transporter periplasmic adaptor subunit [Gemmatimonadota bacterium]
MSPSRRIPTLAILVLVLVALGAGVWWKIAGPGAGNAEGTTAAGGEAGDALPATVGASQFSTSVPQPVAGTKVVRDTLWIRVRAAGQAAAFRRAPLVAQVEGKVEDVRVRENQAVDAGALLVVLDSTDLALKVAQVKADLLTAQADFRQMILFDDEIADPQVREERERIARTRSQLDQREVALRQAELALARTRVRAPFAGRVGDLRVVPGQFVNPGTELLTMVELDPIKVEVQVLEAELGALREGNRGEVTFAAYPGERFVGRIVSINPLVDPETRTGRVTVLLDNPGHRIKPGMYADVALDAEALPDRILVPREAILERGDKRRKMLFVFAREEGQRGLAKWRYVTTGRENDRFVEIVQGDEGMVEPGEIVLVDGHHYLAHDTPVRLVENVSAAGGRPGR